MLRCFIELKYLKEIDKIMFDCFWWHKYFPSFKKCTFSVYTKNNPQKKEKPPEKPNQTTWLQGAFHWQFETEGNYTFLWIKKNKKKTVAIQKPKPLTEQYRGCKSFYIQMYSSFVFFLFLNAFRFGNILRFTATKGQKEWIWHYEFLLKYRMQWKSKPRGDTSGHYIRR